MSKIENSGLDQYGAEPFEQQQFEIAGVEGVKGLLPTRIVSDSPVGRSQGGFLKVGDCLMYAIAYVYVASWTPVGA